MANNSTTVRLPLLGALMSHVASWIAEVDLRLELDEGELLSDLEFGRREDQEELRAWVNTMN